MNGMVIDGKDNVGVSLDGDVTVPAGHKYALRDIREGEAIIKYGEIIGRATKNISKGEWVHTHNLKSHLDEETKYSYNFDAAAFATTERSFMGYKRKSGRAGIRNDIYIIPTVGCVNNVCRKLEKQSQKFISGSIDGIFALTHQFGCSQLGEDNENIKKLLCGIALNPNASYVLFVGLGCENNGIENIKKELNGKNYIEYFNCQNVKDEISYGLEILKGFADKAKSLKRETTDYAELCIGLKCGGSDGYSGLTANPLVGRITDKVVSYGGSAVLTEIPEMFGAEQILMNKCANVRVFKKFVKMIADFKKLYTDHGFPVYENPSPGNRKGGITTLEEKSLGCIKKAGNTKISDILSYGEQVKERGVSVLQSPGNDLVAATALAASGCQAVLFTTGRGTPFSTFVPTLKIASNNVVSDYKNAWIDFNAYGADEKDLFALIEKTLNGDYRCMSEEFREIAFYKTGVTL